MKTIDLPNLKVVNGVPYASSLDIADRFGVKHKNVLQAIEKCFDELKSQPVTAQFADSEFLESTYIDAGNRPRKMYLLSEEGFAMSVFLFKTPQARLWQTRYIMQFKVMRQDLFNRELERIRLRHADQQMLADGMLRDFLSVKDAESWLRRRTRMDITAPKLTQMVKHGDLDGKFVPLKSIVYTDSLRAWLQSLGVLTPHLAEELGGGKHVSN